MKEDCFCVIMKNFTAMKYWFLIVLLIGVFFGCKEEEVGKIDRYAQLSESGGFSF